jgi:hypothetical protein
MAERTRSKSWRRSERKAAYLSSSSTTTRPGARERRVGLESLERECRESSQVVQEKRAERRVASTESEDTAGERLHMWISERGGRG